VPCILPFQRPQRKRLCSSTPASSISLELVLLAHPSSSPTIANMFSSLALSSSRASVASGAGRRSKGPRKGARQAVAQRNVEVPQLLTTRQQAIEVWGPAEPSAPASRHDLQPSRPAQRGQAPSTSKARVRPRRRGLLAGLKSRP
jgi:hypothetical protein